MLPGILGGVLDAGWNLLAFVVVIGFLIFIHEAGHFSVAKALGIRVEVFSLGFGPRLLGWRRGGTDYRLSLVPLGGYVRLLGEMPEDEREGSREELLSRSRFERFLVYFAGPAMNVVVAFLLFTTVFLVGVRQPAALQEPPVIGRVMEGTPAAAAGMLAGDRILEANGEPVATFEALRLFVLMHPEEKVTFRVDRGGGTLDLEATPSAENRHRVGYLGVDPWTPAEVVSVEPGGPAQKAGLRPGDRVLFAGGERVHMIAADTLAKLLEARGGAPVDLQVRRGTEDLVLAVAPDLSLPAASSHLGAELGVPLLLKRYGPAGAVGAALREMRDLSTLLFELLGRLAGAKMSLRAISGPLEIAMLSGASARQGGAALLHFMALVSLQLGILNLLPLPALDGGHILILAVEGLIRRDLSVRLKERLAQGGMLLLLLLMAVVVYLDIVKTFFS